MDYRLKSSKHIVSRFQYDLPVRGSRLSARRPQRVGRRWGCRPAVDGSYPLRTGRGGRVEGCSPQTYTPKARSNENFLIVFHWLCFIEMQV